MAIPDYQTIMKPLLELLSDGREYKLAEIRDLLAPKFRVTQSERRRQLPSGDKTYNNRVRWASKYLVEACLIVRVSRGVYCITTRGQSVVKMNPRSIDKKHLMRFPEFVKYLNK